MKRLGITFTVGALFVGAYTGTAAVAGPPGTDCTNGRQNTEHGVLLLAVADLAPLGYLAPSRLDDPANGGNGDGFVCGIPMGNQTTPFGGQLYLFSDNQVFTGPN